MRSRQVVVAAVVYVCAVFVVATDMTIVQVALPTIGREFHRPPIALAAVSTVYALSTAVFIPASGWLGDRLGARTLILGATAVFTVASALCGVAQSLPQLLAARALQGAVGGLMAPVGLALLYRLVAVEHRVRLAGLLAIPTALGPALGPVLGGVLTEQLSWRWAFFINVPVGVAVVVYGLLFLEPHRQPGDHRLDGVGLLLAGGGLSLLLLAISEAPVHGPASGRVLGSAVAGALLLTLLVRWELRSEHPAVDVRLLGDGLFRWSTTALAVGTLSYAAYLYTTTQLVQNVVGLAPQQAGLIMLPMAAGFLLGAQVAARLVFPRVGPRKTMQLGLLGLAATLVAMLLVDRDSSLWLLGGLLLLGGTCAPIVFVPSQSAAFGTVAAASLGRASMFYSSQRQVFSALGVAAAATALTALAPTGSVDAAVVLVAGPYHAAFAGSAVVAVAGAVLLQRMDDSAYPWRQPTHDPEERHDQRPHDVRRPDLRRAERPGRPCMRPGRQALSWWVRRLPDCEPAGVFWRDVVGLPLLGQKGSGWDDEGPYYLFSGGSFLEFELLPGAQPRPAYVRKEQQARVPVFRTYAFDATLASWLAGGARLLERADEPGGRTAYLVEPGGSITGLREPDPGSTDQIDVAAAAEHARGGSVLAGAKPMPAGVHDLAWAQLHVVDVDREVAFYRDVLGLEVLLDRGADGAVLDLGDLKRLDVRPGGEPEQVPSDRLEVAEMWMLRVTDMDAVVADLRAAGTHFVHEPWDVTGGTIAYVTDPEDRLVGVQSHRQDGRPTELEAHRRLLASGS